MAPAKTVVKTQKKSTSSKSKRTSKKIESKPRSFTVRGLTRERGPQVEPLYDDENTAESEMMVPVKHMVRSERPSEVDVPPPVQIAPISSMSQQSAVGISGATSFQNVPHMEVTHIPSYTEEIDEEEELDEEPYLQSLDIDHSNPRDTIKVKFGKFVQLVNSHDFADVVTSHSNEEIIMSTDLLTELAGAQDRREERKIPLVFLVGIAIGVVLTYIFFSPK